MRLKRFIFRRRWCGPIRVRFFGAVTGNWLKRRRFRGELADSNLSALARRMSIQQALALPSPAASNTVVINARCSLRIEAGQRVIVVAGLPVHHYRAEDAVAEAYAMVFLVASGFAQQTDQKSSMIRAGGRWAGWLPYSAQVIGVWVTTV